jgi:hypothetical protein
VAQPRGGVAQVESAREKLAGGVMPPAFDVELHPGGICGRRDLVGNPVRVPRPDMRRVVGEQVRVISQPDSDLDERVPDLVQIVRDQRAGVRVDGEPAVLMRLGVLADALTAADDAN